MVTIKKSNNDAKEIFKSGVMALALKHYKIYKE